MFDDESDFSNTRLVTYLDIIVETDSLIRDIRGMQEDQLIDVIDSLDRKVLKEEEKKISRIHDRYYQGKDISKSDLDFLKNLFIIYHCKYALKVDSKEDDIAQ